MAALYSAAIGVREIAKFASQKARPPSRVSTNAFFQILFEFFIFFSFLYSGFTDNRGLTALMESHKARETSAIKLIAIQG
jgi:hypothetical protein